MQEFNSSHPEWRSLTAEELRNFALTCRVMEKRDSSGRVLFMVMTARTQKGIQDTITDQNPYALMKFEIWAYDRLSYDIDVQINGLVMFFNFDGMIAPQNNLSTMPSTTCLSAQFSGAAAFTYATETLGLNLCQVFYVNQPEFISHVWPMTLSLLKPKLANNIHLCGTDYKKVIEYVGDPSALPFSAGGTIPDNELIFDWTEEQMEAEFKEKIMDFASNKSR